MNKKLYFGAIEAILNGSKIKAPVFEVLSKPNNLRWMLTDGKNTHECFIRNDSVSEFAKSVAVGDRVILLEYIVVTMKWIKHISINRVENVDSTMTVKAHRGQLGGLARARKRQEKKERAQKAARASAKYKSRSDNKLLKKQSHEFTGNEDSKRYVFQSALDVSPNNSPPKTPADTVVKNDQTQQNYKNPKAQQPHQIGYSLPTKHNKINSQQSSLSGMKIEKKDKQNNPRSLTNLNPTKIHKSAANSLNRLASDIPSTSSNPLNLLVENWMIRVPTNAEDVSNEIEEEAEDSHKLPTIEPPPKYVCTFCNELYRNRQEFLPHLLIVHRVESRNEKNLDIIQAISRVTSLEIKSATGSLELTNNDDDDDEEDKAARADKETNEVPLHLEMEPKKDTLGRIICLLCETVMIPNFFCFHLVNAHNLRAYRDLDKCIQMYTVKNAAKRTNQPVIKSEPCECSVLDLNNLRNVESEKDHHPQVVENIPKKAATNCELPIKEEPTDCETEVAPTLIPKVEKTPKKESQVGNHNCLADHDYQIATTFVESKEEEIPS